MNGSGTPPRDTGATGDALRGAPSLMFKPVGSRCNGGCVYCYYRDRGHGSPGMVMPLEVVEEALQGYLSRAGGRVVLTWQGGEPTLAGMEFFGRVVRMVQRYARPGQLVLQALQTNGSTLDEPWCRFLRAHRFLVGLSLDGPPAAHDRYRTIHGLDSAHEAAVRALRLLQSHGLACNVLTVVHRDNVEAPDAILDHLLHEGARWLQFIPVVEWEQTRCGPRLAPFCPDPSSFGRFMCRILDRWLERGGCGFAERTIDALVHVLATGAETLCVFAKTCAHTLTLEVDGAVYPCDHFVTPEWFLGTVRTDAARSEARTWLDELDTDRLQRFLRRKQDLPAQCRECPWVRFCGGGCPKHRPAPHLPSVLCPAYRLWFSHAVPRLREVVAKLGLGARAEGASPPG